jgi:hypothetical protein
MSEMLQNGVLTGMALHNQSARANHMLRYGLKNYQSGSWNDMNSSNGTAIATNALSHSGQNDRFRLAASIANQ